MVDGAHPLLSPALTLTIFKKLPIIVLHGRRQADRLFEIG